MPLVISADGTIQFTANVSATYYNYIIVSGWNPTSGTWYIQLNGSNVVASATSSTNNVKAYEYKTLPASTKEPTITGNPNTYSETGQTGNFNHTDAEYTIEYSYYKIGNTSYYWYNSALYDTAPSPNGDFTYTWSLSSNVSSYASVDNTGKVTYSSLVPEPTVSAELICTATHTSGAEAIATFPLTFTNDKALNKPTIEITPNGTTATVTITGEEGTTIYYTTDGTNPTESSTNGSSPVTLTNVANQTVIKAFAKKTGYSNSLIAVNEFITSGVVNGVVVLNDYEDHRWTYYAGVDESVDGGNYNTNYAGKMYSPNPRNVKITYNGVNNVSGSTTNVKVSTKEGEGQNTFVYYKTLEQSVTTGEYPYQVISNPFSVRPSTGSGTGKVYYGFAGWKIKSGGEYIKGHNDNDVLGLDEEIVFEKLPYPSVNCTSAEIVFETTWTQAKVQRGGANVSNASFNGGTYETNFCVINSNSNGLNPTYPVTITGVEPDGSTTYSYTITGMVRPSNSSVAKMEYVTWNPNGAIAFQDRNVTIGRGVICSGTVRDVTASDGGDNISQTLKIESGSYGSFTHYSGQPTSSSFVKQHVYLGCDYDRAKNDNTKLTFEDEFLGNRIDGGSGYTQEAYRMYSKSGSFMTGISINNAAQANSYYLSRYTTSAPGRSRYLEIEGGEWYANISGGQDNSGSTPNNKTAFTLRMRGGKVRGSIYGAAQQTNCIGDRVIVVTGGQIGGWIAGAANGIQSGSGYLYGRTYVYLGGKAEIATKYQERTNSATTSIQNSIGGYVFASGCGYNASSHAGEVTVSTNVVMADNAIVEHGVYGGGAYGYSSGTAYIYVTGGHVLSEYDSKYSVFGGVYGGARQNDGGYVNVYMTGGQIDGIKNGNDQGGGLFGGSNASGTIDNSVKMVITGGQVGTSANNANIHGGGLGASTKVLGDVDLTLGIEGQIVNGAKIYGNVYGGSALGTTGGTGKHTHVTVNRGSVTGNVFGGGMGEHGNATEGVVTGAINVTINGTDPAPNSEQYALTGVYGGGDYAPYAGTPVVSVNNCDNSIEYVYGGGNATSVSGTDITIWGGNKIGNVFGGGNGLQYAADVTNSTNVKIYGGTILNVYGGSNTNGTIGGTINVNIDKDGDCPMKIGNVYGGGNKAASNVGNINIGCTGEPEEGEGIETVFGGANAANITGDIALNIRGGKIGTVYGGNNASGTISGSVTVNIDKKINETTLNNCGVFDIGTVYGGGKKADMALAANVVTVNINDNGGEDDNKTIGNVYGGGEEASVYSATVNLRGGTITGNVFGGGKGVAGNTDKVMILNGGTHVNAFGGTVANIFGGNDAGGTINGSLNVIVDKQHTGDASGYTYKELTITEDVYGGGNQANSAAGSIDIKCANAIRNVFGGAKNADVSGNITLSVGSGQIQNIYGGNNLGGTAGGNITVNVTKVEGDCGEGFTVVNVFGGGYGKDTNTGGNVTVNIGKSATGGAAGDATIFGDVYGGSALGAVNAGTTNTTTVNLYGGTLSGNVYGGGLGQLAAAATETKPAKEKISAVVKGSTAVNVYAGTTFVPAKDSENKYTYTTGMVFGCNNMAGAPAGTATVTVNGTSTLLSVYGGGNLADYTGNPTVHVLNGTLAGNVFGGGLGESAVVVGNPAVNIGDWVEGHSVSIGGSVFGGGDEAAVEGDPVVVIRNCGTTVVKDVYGGGNAAPTYSTNLTIWGGQINGNVFGGGNGERGADYAANVGYDRNDDKSSTASGNAVTNIYGGTFGAWNGNEYVSGGGIFGGSNSNGNIKGDVLMTLDGRLCEEDGAEKCTLKLKEAYGAGNMASFEGNGITFNLGCVDSFDEVYGGAKAADLGTESNPIDVHLIITSGTFGKVFAGNNVSGKLNANIKVTVDETGCNPVIIGGLYGGGNLAPYSVYGYNEDGTAKTTGTKLFDYPEVNVISCTHIGQVFGGGKGATAIMVGNPVVNVNEIKGAFAEDDVAKPYVNDDKLGSIGEVFGGGDAADVIGDTHVNIGTEASIAHVTGNDTTTKEACGVNITGNVYGGGSAADVTGKTYVTVGKK